MLACRARMLSARPRVLATGGLLAGAALSLTLSRYRIAVCRGRDVLLPCPENLMPRRKSLIAQMYEARRKRSCSSRSWKNRPAGPGPQKSARSRLRRRRRPRSSGGKKNALPRPGSGTSSRPSVLGSRRRGQRLAAQQQREQERQAAAEAREQQRREAEERREQQARRPTGAAGRWNGEWRKPRSGPRPCRPR